MGRTIGAVLETARQRLVGASFRPPAREGSLLLAKTLGWSEAQLLARSDQQLDESALREFEMQLARRLTGEPMAYILGEKEFFGRPFKVDHRVLIPRPETEHLIEVVLELPLPAWPTLLDIGTGSGCLAATLALELPAARVLAVDSSIESLEVASQNLAQFELRNRVRLLASDLSSAIDLSRLDLVVTNPPYIGLRESESLSTEILDFEPHEALFAGPEGDQVLGQLFASLHALRPGAWLITEIGAGQSETIRLLATDSPFDCLEIRPDYAGHPRVALLRRN